MLREAKGNMYPWITHTWNTVKGKCPHGCAYCYMTRWGEQKPMRFDEKELKTDLGRDNFIFVGSSCDMWAGDVPGEWIQKTLERCIMNDRYNRYLFQSKNPERMRGWALPAKTVIGTTIESNRHFADIMNMSPEPHKRAEALSRFPVETMVTIEPIMDFDLLEMVQLIRDCSPRWVNIGANTHPRVKVPEPEPYKIQFLIEALNEFVPVKAKANLKRLVG